MEYLAEAGRGRAIKKVWSESRADILSYMDVDLSTDLGAFPPLIEALINGGFNVGTGSRGLNSSETERGFKREFLSWGYHMLLKASFHARFSDVQCGFKAITGNAANKLLPSIEDNGWLMDAELLILAERLGYRVCELPVHWLEDLDTWVKVGRDTIAPGRGLLRLRRNLSVIKHCQPRLSERATALSETASESSQRARQSSRKL